MASIKKIAPEYAPLYAQVEGVEKHWKLLLKELSEVLPGVAGKYYFEPSTFQGIIGDLKSQNFLDQKASRARGAETPVVPLILTKSSNVDYWLSLHQEWQEDSSPRARRLIYYTTSLTVFFGPATSNEKLQLFRAEWPGVRLQTDGTYVFEAMGAGHPHWQFDAYQSRAREIESERLRLIELGHTLNDLYRVEDFSETIITELSSEDLAARDRCLKRLTRIHFASCANWAVLPWTGDDLITESHARGPKNPREIINWIVSTIRYIQSEVRR
jgi:hypothetical protein